MEVWDFTLNGLWNMLQVYIVGRINIDSQHLFQPSDSFEPVYGTAFYDNIVDV